MSENRDFVPNTLGLKIRTPSGFQRFSGIAFMGEKPIYELKFSNRRSLECTALHRLFRPDGTTVHADALQVGDWVLRGDGKKTKVISAARTGRIEPVYDVIGVDGGHRYVTNGITSHNCEFVSDDETLIDGELLAELKYVEPEFYTGTVRWFKDPQPNRIYLVGLDPSMGTGRDYAAIQVFELPGMEQVAEWQHNKTPAKKQMTILRNILLFLWDELRAHPEQIGEPEIYWTIENNSLGEANLVVLEDTGEERFPGNIVNEPRRKGVARGRFRKGLNTTPKTKYSACSRMKSLIETGRMIINSQELLRQLKNFVNKGVSYSAKPGENDDLVSASLLCTRMLDAIIKQGVDIRALQERISDDEMFETIDDMESEDGAMPVVV